MHSLLPSSVKKALITVVGGLLLAIGVIFIVLPGPAILFIPAGLLLLSKEYPKAKDWLKKFQVFSSASARKADQIWSSVKYTWRSRRISR